MKNLNPHPLDAYRERTEEIARQAEQNLTRSGNASRGLSLLAAAAVVIAYQAWSAKSLPPWLPFLLVPWMAYLLVKLRDYRRESQRGRSLREYYERGVARLKLHWDELDDGADFSDAKHFYASDLDLFGRGSLFQVLCSARTHAGRETLAAWMKAPASREEALERRAAIEELVGREDLRERIAAAGRSAVSDCRPETFRSWLAEKVPPFPGWAPAAALVLAGSALALPILYWAHAVRPDRVLWAALVVGLLQYAVARTFGPRVDLVLESLRLPSIELPILAELLAILEAERFQSARLVSLTGGLGSAGGRASEHMRRLAGLVQWLDLRDNPMFTLASYGLLWATQFAMAVDGWRHRHGAELIEWLRVLGEMEALVSLSTYAREHPGDAWPELVDGAPEFDAREMGHPLLEEEMCVRNSVRLDGETRFLIVSGSNMSGKSTFLRSMGQNAVLAWMGAPVRCAGLRVSELTIAAAIRLQDSLVDGRSHFFAEMDRLRRMIAAAGERPMLFLVDEIMSGTNSHDRRIAAEWVVRALLKRGAMGAITTHDLALTEIAGGGLPGRNVHFEDSGEGGKLEFDYVLRAGILTRSNALNIAHLLGIDEAAG